MRTPMLVGTTRDHLKSFFSCKVMFKNLKIQSTPTPPGRGITPWAKAQD
jgi:hypothetical protein